MYKRQTFNTGENLLETEQAAAIVGDINLSHVTSDNNF